MGCRPKTLLFALIEKADAPRDAVAHQRECFRYTDPSWKRNNKQHLAPVSNGMAARRHERRYQAEKLSRARIVQRLSGVVLVVLAHE